MTDADLYTGFAYSAINNRANGVAQLATENLKTRAKQTVMDAARKKDEVVSHPYLKILDESKTFANYKFWYDIPTYLDLEGVYYLMAVRTVADGANGKKRVGNIQEFKLLNPYEVKRVRNLDTLEIGGYLESHDGLYREIVPEMIIEIEMLNPFSRNDPYGMTDAMKDSQFTIKSAGDYTRHAIANNINAPGVISSDVLLAPELFENFKSRIVNHEKPGEPLFGNGSGAINWQDMQIDLNKAALDKVHELNLNSVSATSGVSKTMFGIEQSGVTRDTAKVQKDLFIANHVTPLLQRIIDALNQDYKRYYEADYIKNGYTLYIDSPLGVDRDAEIKDIQIRKESYELYVSQVNEGYEHELAAKYANGEIGLADLGEPTNEPASIIEGSSTKPSSTSEDQEDEDASKKTSATATNSVAVIEHSDEHIPAIKNQFDEESQGIVTIQQGMLQNAIVNIEEQVSLAVLNKVTKNAFEEQSDIISEREKQDFIDELALAIATFYGIILPTYAKTTMNRRAAEFGLFGNFKFNSDVKEYIKTISAKAAESHMNTILEDLRGAIKETYDEQVKSSLKTLIEGEAAQLPPEQGAKLLSTPIRKDSDIYRLAQKKALEGSGQQEIIRAVKNEYKDISTNRAKTIARTEVNNVFTISQYEADKQFIKQNGLEARAYKKWITRSSNPCALCLAKAAEPPIPFGDPFAVIGDEVSGSYEENGKIKVLKQKISYEDVYAGDLHPNGSCTYQLIIM